MLAAVTFSEALFAAHYRYEAQLPELERQCEARAAELREGFGHAGKWIWLRS